MSLFLLALELTLPPTAAVLTLHSAKDVLFNVDHLPLLFASIIPAFFLSISIRLPSLEKASFGLTQHALYVPAYMLAVAAIFWVTVAGIGSTDSDGLHHLSSRGWLFTLQDLSGHDQSLESAWNYWTYFDFSLVRWSAIGKAIQDIVLLVLIGVLNLPIYVPAMALSLDIPVYHMNHELFGHGISNILAGIVGTVPNLVVITPIPRRSAQTLICPGIFFHSLFHACRRRSIGSLHRDCDNHRPIFCLITALTIRSNDPRICACPLSGD